MILVTLRLILYIVAFIAVLYSVYTVSRVPGNGSKHGLQLMLVSLIAYAGILVLATATKLCFDTGLAQWLFTVAASITIISQLLLWRWWKGS